MIWTSRIWHSSRRLAGPLLFVAMAAACVQTPRAADTSEQAMAEALIDAFYAFNPARLQLALAHAPKSAPRMLFYQGWAEGANYQVLKRDRCRWSKVGEMTCDIRVKDDLITALGTGFDVTDPFHLTFENGRIVSVRTTSNDPPEFEQALQWLGQERPQILDGPCRGFFDGGPTPQACARTVVKGFADFVRRPTPGS